MASCEPLRGRAYDEDIRWRMIYQREMLGLTFQEVANNLNVDTSTVWRVVKQFREQGSVSAKKNTGISKLSDIEQFAILECVLQNPAVYLREIQRYVGNVTGTETVSESAICRFLQRNNFSRKKLSYVASQRSQVLRQEFLADCSLYSPEMLVILDESGCDKRLTMRKFGYAMKGTSVATTIDNMLSLP